MERKKSERLGAVMAQYLAQSGLQSQLNEYRVVQAWEKVAGHTVALRTKDVGIRNGKLHVRITSAAMRADLMMRRTELVRRLNAEAGAQVITDIAFQ